MRSAEALHNDLMNIWNASMFHPIIEVLNLSEVSLRTLKRRWLKESCSEGSSCCSADLVAAGVGGMKVDMVWSLGLNPVLNYARL